MVPKRIGHRGDFQSREEIQTDGFFGEFNVGPSFSRCVQRFELWSLRFRIPWHWPLCRCMVFCGLKEFFKITMDFWKNVRFYLRVKFKRSGGISLLCYHVVNSSSNFNSRWSTVCRRNKEHATEHDRDYNSVFTVHGSV